MSRAVDPIEDVEFIYSWRAVQLTDDFYTRLLFRTDVLGYEYSRPVQFVDMISKRIVWSFTNVTDAIIIHFNGKFSLRN